MNGRWIFHTLLVLAIGYALGIYFPSIGNSVKAKIGAAI
jgi:hypothetical protein